MINDKNNNKMTFLNECNKSEQKIKIIINENRKLCRSNYLYIFRTFFSCHMREI